MVSGRARWTGVVLLLAAVSAAVFGARLVRRGFSARDEPSRVEALAARAMRRLAVPAALRDRGNPVPLTPAVLAEGRAHYADHCAVCHGSDGRGQTAMGPNFYPRVPDMTLPETQSQTDGELFATIENGIRLTGMPAWGNGSEASAQGSWVLVHFIRSLPRLTTAEKDEIASLVPKTKEEWEAEAEAQRFLDGDTGTGGR
jgi:mono/diheme cytochrome c family protein